MLFDNTYKTITNNSEGNFKDRGSKFLAYAFSVNNEVEAKACIQQLKKEHPSATHHCYAFVLGADKAAFRASDDGEPSGTAGKPILNTIYSFGLTNILVVVVRYFGGTQLGVPGLINAYKEAAKEALQNADVEEKFVEEFYSLTFDYINMNDVMRIIKSNNIRIVDQSSGEAAAIGIAVNSVNADPVLENLKKISNLEVKYLYTA